MTCLGKILRRLKYRLLLAKWFVSEMAFYQKAASLPFSRQCDAFLERELMVEIHALEKGFAHEKRKRDFGKERVERIARYLNECAAAGKSADDFSCRLGREAISARRTSEVVECEQGSLFGVRYVSEEDAFKNDVDFPAFAERRFSVRLFDCESPEVDLSVIERAVAIAQTAPQACNRQGVRVYYVSRGNSDFQALTQIQGGCAGFSENAAGILAVTVDAGLYSLGEYPLMFVDAGLFVMNLVYALQYERVGTCILNGTLGSARQKAARELLCCSQREHLAAFVLVSRIPAGERILQGQAARRPLDEVFTVM